MSRPNGGPAFPSIEPVEQFDDDAGKYKTLHLPCGGMTLRDYFAAKALGAIVAKHYDVNYHDGERGRRTARHAYEYADAMLAEREK